MQNDRQNTGCPKHDVALCGSSVVAAQFLFSSAFRLFLIGLLPCLQDSYGNRGRVKPLIRTGRCWR